MGFFFCFKSAKIFCDEVFGMEKKNYDIEMQRILHENEKIGRVPTLLLHTCCAPCSSAVLLRLADFFRITVFYYNPNIEPREEYEKRKEEQKRFLREFKTTYPISFLDCDYEHEEFDKISMGLEREKEGGSRCFKCYRLRLRKTVQKAKELHFDYFGTSLTVSPYKNAGKINEIGEELALEYGVSFLYSDFKKHDGYRESIRMSKEYNLYRQDYCGCHFSLQERLDKEKQKSNSVVD